jgi:SAM-dependent methyltransferase
VLRSAFRRRHYRARENYRPNYEQLAAGLVATIDFDSHLDVGCGQGLLLEPLLTRHGKDVHGFELSPAAREFLPATLRDRVETRSAVGAQPDRDYDLVSCVEVIEHIPEAESIEVVRFLAASARKWIYFSAAIPGQPGVGHINCQPTLYWLLRFDEVGWRLDLERSRALHERIRGMRPCWWLPQNALILSPAAPR